MNYLLDIMNIYYTSASANVCALAYCDRHLVFEIVQMAKALSTAHYVYRSKFAMRLYKPYHNTRHPIVHWIIRNDKNYKWTYELFTSMLTEFEFRFEHPHKTRRLLNILRNPPKRMAMVASTSVRPQALPHKYYVKGDPIMAYRGYYHYEIKSAEKWTNREPPEWLYHYYGDEQLPNLYHRPRNRWMDMETSGTSSYTWASTDAAHAYIYTDNTV